ncbi:DUF1775 domain-containing protein [Pseudonocardia sp. GCM10023141]|uniref:DUF1775 domain-containing protein n=1 Tax=Pseudonocardia sp. GCM10023141 TaxID=3252653 RepID=UPI00361551D4
MACSRTSLPRALAATVTTALTSLILMLALAPAASARVSIVPGTVEGGKIAKLAIRLSNERTDVVATRLELTFPKDAVVPRAEVARNGKWNAAITMRPLDPPVTVNGKEIDEAVDSIVWTGSEVASRQFEQFLVTAGPLPADGQLTFAAVEGYADGTVEQWSQPAAAGMPGAPTLKLGPPRAVLPGAGSTSVPAANEGFTEDQSSPLPWLLLAGGLLVAAVTGVVGYQGLQRRQKPVRRSPVSVGAGEAETATETAQTETAQTEAMQTEATQTEAGQR